MRQRHQGYSLIEMIIVIAIMAILISIAVAQIRAPSARAYAQDLKAVIQEARYRSINRNLPVAVVWDPNLYAFLVRVPIMTTNSAGNRVFHADTDTLAEICTDGQQVVFSDAGAYPNLTVDVSGLSGNLVWFPNGFAKDCNNTIINGDVTLMDGTTNLSVYISAGGLVRVDR